MGLLGETPKAHAKDKVAMAKNFNLVCHFENLSYGV
jgi:hypothetical protein